MATENKPTNTTSKNLAQGTGGTVNLANTAQPNSPEQLRKRGESSSVGSESKYASLNSSQELNNSGINGQGKDESLNVSEENLFKYFNKDGVEVIPNEKSINKSQNVLLDNSSITEFKDDSPRSSISNESPKLNTDQQKPVSPGLQPKNSKIQSSRVPNHLGKEDAIEHEPDHNPAVDKLKTADLSMNESVNVNKANKAAEVNSVAPKLKLSPEMQSAIQNLYNNTKEIDEAKKNGRDISKLEKSEDNLIKSFKGEFNKLNVDEKRPLETLAQNLTAIKNTQKGIDDAFKAPGSQNLIPHTDKNGYYEEISQFAKNTESLRQHIDNARNNILTEAANLIPSQELEEQYNQQHNKPKTAKKGNFAKLKNAISNFFGTKKKDVVETTVTKNTHYETDLPNNNITKPNATVNRGNEQQESGISAYYSSFTDHISPAHEMINNQGTQEQVKFLHDCHYSTGGKITDPQEFQKYLGDKAGKEFVNKILNDPDLGPILTDINNKAHEKVLKREGLKTLNSKARDTDDGNGKIHTIMGHNNEPMFEIGVTKDGRVNFPTEIKGNGSNLKGNSNLNISVMVKTAQGQFCSAHFSQGKLVDFAPKFAKDSPIVNHQEMAKVAERNGREFAQRVQNNMQHSAKLSQMTK